MPTIAWSPSIRAISVAQIGTPRMKFLVPSIGSITHTRLPGPAGASVAPNSSPSTPSRGRARVSVPRSARSTAVSASETGVRSGLASTRRSSARNRAIATASAASASTWESARSSAYPAMTGNLAGSGPRTGPYRDAGAAGGHGTHGGPLGRIRRYRDLRGSRYHQPRPAEHGEVGRGDQPPVAHRPDRIPGGYQHP